MRSSFFPKTQFWQFSLKLKVVNLVDLCTFSLNTQSMGTPSCGSIITVFNTSMGPQSALQRLPKKNVESIGHLLALLPFWGRSRTFFLVVFLLTSKSVIQCAFWNFHLSVSDVVSFVIHSAASVAGGPKNYGPVYLTMQSLSATSAAVYSMRSLQDNDNDSGEYVCNCIDLN